MSRGADPLAIRTNKQWRPYGHSPRNQRVQDRQHMYGSRIYPMNDNRRDPTARFFIIGALVIAGFFVAQMLRWFV